MGTSPDHDPNPGNAGVVEALRSGRPGSVVTGLDLLLLTTTGARTGKERTRPVAYLTDGDDYVVLADNAGRDRHPAWYFNMLAHPAVTLEVAGRRFTATALVTEGAERARLFSRFARRYPDVTVHQARTRRAIPVVVLRP